MFRITLQSQRLNYWEYVVTKKDDNAVPYSSLGLLLTVMEVFIGVLKIRLMFENKSIHQNSYADARWQLMSVRLSGLGEISVEQL